MGNKLSFRTRMILIGLAVFLSVFACSTPVSPTPSVTYVYAPTQTETFTPTVTQTVLPTSTQLNTPTPSNTLTAIPSSTSTPDFQTPTPISTLSIIEVTPLGGDGYVAQGWQPLPTGTYYIPANNLYIRTGPGTEYAKTGKMVSAGERVTVYSLHHWTYSGERWLCLDDSVEEVSKEYLCARTVAYIVDSVQWGNLWLP